MAPKGKGKPATPPSLVTVPVDGDIDCVPLLNALQDETLSQAATIVSTILQLSPREAIAVGFSYLQTAWAWHENSLPKSIAGKRESLHRMPSLLPKYLEICWSR